MIGTSLRKNGLSVGTAAFAQATQAATSLGLSVLAARLLGLETLGKFSIIYGCMILAAALTSGFVGDTLTVLDRTNRRIRAGLAGWTVLIVAAASSGAIFVSWSSGFLSAGAALLFGLATASFMLEDLVRRQHMASMTFARLLWIDAVVFATSLGTVLIGVLGNTVTLSLFLMAMSVGQLAGAIFGWSILPTSERHRMGRPAAWGVVANYGIWRAAQQGLRPALQTSMKISVTVFISLGAAGLLESARIYAAPAMILAGGIFSFIFSHLAKGRKTPLSEQLRHTDQSVLRVVAVTLFCSVVALVCLPWAGPLVTGSVPSAMAVCGWLAYTLAVGSATPYGLLAAVREYPRQVFIIRSLDTFLSLILVLAVVATGADYRWVPWAAALGSGIGGILLRRLVLHRIGLESAQVASAVGAAGSESHEPTQVFSGSSAEGSCNSQITHSKSMILHKDGNAS